MKLSYVILYVQDIEKSVQFYQKAFGIKHKFTHEGGDYAEMETGDTTLAFCVHDLAENLIGKNYAKATSDVLLGSQITFEPNDVKKAYQKAIETGAMLVSQPEVKPWNFEVAIVKDLDGHIVELAKNLA
ncbi:MAG: VOC family protein [Ghiorsea sp.]|nr:VOC family protein [Ghiorsea sp.]